VKFTAEEDETIRKYMETTTSPTPFADLSRTLQRIDSSVKTRSKEILKHE